jgi:NADP-dependent 3-hydroxy acid dehydrogenase YdfG
MPGGHPAHKGRCIQKEAKKERRREGEKERRREGEKDMRFRDKIALISGAGSGIGRATAHIMGTEAGTVIGADINQDSLEQVMRGIRQAGGRANAIVADALNPEQVTRAVQQTAEEL